MRALCWIGWLPILVLMGCPEEEYCEGGAPYDGPCTCGADGSEAVEGHVDADVDGFGGAETGWYCGGGYASNGNDCDDTDASLNPADRDGDGFSSCDQDCDDDNPATYPGADEICDGEDNDCDGTITGEDDADGDGYRLCDGDCDDENATVTPHDEDGDGAGGCDDPPDCDDTDADLNVDDHDGDGASSCDGDCDDADAALNLDDLDGDGSTTCDGDCDDTDPTVEALDADGDGDTTCDGDCDDDDPDLNLDDLDLDGFTPCDGDCHDFNDSLTPEDADGDGQSSCDGDCDDGDPTVLGDVATTSGWVRECPLWLAADTADAEWWFHRVEQPSVLFDGVDHVVYYRTGYWLDQMGFGAVQSPDGVTWSRVGNGPLFTGTAAPGDWDEEGVSNPRLVYDPADVTNPYKLYYSAKSNVTGQRNIGLAVGSDWQSWTRYGIVLPAGGPGELDSVTAGTPYVWIDGGTYYMVYLCDDGSDRGLCLATSADLGYTWDKWDPEPGVGFDPQPLVTLGDPGDWDDDKIAFPVWLGSGAAEGLLYAGKSGGEYAAGVAHAPFGPEDGVTKLNDLAPVLEASALAGRWDDKLIQPSDWIEAGGTTTLLYSGATEDLGFDGEEVVQIGAATNEAPTIALTAPAADPHVMNTADPVVFSGTVTDTLALDELHIVIQSYADDTVLLTTVADVAGSWTLTAPGGTFVDAPAPYLVSVAVVDAGGLAEVATISFDVSP